MKRNRNLRKLTAVSAGVLGSLSATRAATAAITTPAGLNPGDKFHMVFLSAGTTTAVSSAPSGYDAMVAAEAVTNGLSTYNSLPVTWQTLGSFFGGPDANDRFNPAYPVYTLDGDLVANNGTDLYDGTIANPINVFADLTVSSGANVWTGSNANGDELFPVFNKSIGSPDGSGFGQAITTDADWIWIGDTTGTGAEHHLYAFSSELTVPVPEPTTSVIAVIGVVLAAIRRPFRKHHQPAAS